MSQIFCCSIFQEVNYHQRNVRSRVSVSNFLVSAIMTKSRSRLEIWARSRRLRSRLHHCNLLPKAIWAFFLWKYAHLGLVFSDMPHCFSIWFPADFCFVEFSCQKHVGLVFQLNYIFRACFSKLLAYFCKITRHHWSREPFLRVSVSKVSGLEGYRSRDFEYCKEMVW